MESVISRQSASQDMTTNESKAHLVVPLCPGVQFGKAPIGAIFGKNPVEGSEGCAGRCRIRSAACAPGIERGQQDGLDTFHGLGIVSAKRFIADRAPITAR